MYKYLSVFTGKDFIFIQKILISFLSLGLDLPWSLSLDPELGSRVTLDLEFITLDLEFVSLDPELGSRVSPAPDFIKTV